MTSSLIPWEGFISLSSASWKPPNYRSIQMNCTEQCIIPGNLCSWHLHSTWLLQGHNCLHTFMCSLEDHLRTFYQVDNKTIRQGLSVRINWLNSTNKPYQNLSVFPKIWILTYSLVFMQIHWSSASPWESWLDQQPQSIYRQLLAKGLKEEGRWHADPWNFYLHLWPRRHVHIMMSWGRECSCLPEKDSEGISPALWPIWESKLGVCLIQLHL